MKDKTKKILAAACLGLVGIGCLTGCDMTAEDLSKWEQKADAVIEKLESANETTKESNILLEQQLSKLSKQEAYDILSNANTNMKLLNIRNTPYMYEERRFSPNVINDDDEDYEKMIVIPTEKTIINKKFYWDDDEDKYSNDYQLTKLDINDSSMTYICGIDEGEEIAIKPSQEDWAEVKKMLTSFSDTNNYLALRDFNMDNILSYSCDENGVYTFNVIISYVYDTNSAEDIVDYSKYVNHYTITVKDGYFQTVDRIDFYDRDCEFILDANQEKIPDGFGGYETSSNLRYEEKSSMTFKYGDVIDSDEIESINAMIAKYDELAKNNQIPEGGIK